MEYQRRVSGRVGKKQQVNQLEVGHQVIERYVAVTVKEPCFHIKKATLVVRLILPYKCQCFTR